MTALGTSATPAAFRPSAFSDALSDEKFMSVRAESFALLSVMTSPAVMLLAEKSAVIVAVLRGPLTAALPLTVPDTGIESS